MCDELDERSAREIVMLALFGFFTQRVVPFTHKTHANIEEIDNEQQSSVAVTSRDGTLHSLYFIYLNKK